MGSQPILSTKSTVRGRTADFRIDSARDLPKAPIERTKRRDQALMRMNKYRFPIYKKEYIQKSLQISLLERLLLLFVPSVKVEDDESVSHFKRLFGKIYLCDFKLKGV